MDDDLLFDSESKRKQDAVQKVLHCWNGDPRDFYPEHFCETGSCDDTDECADKMVSAAAESGLLCGMKASHCSESKLGSCYTSAAKQAGGFMLNNIQGNAILHSGITWQNSGNAFVHEMPDGLIDIQQKCRNKVWRSRKYMGSPEKRQTVCEIVWYSAPMDHCWRRIQVLDTQENSLFDIAIPETNPFLQTSARLHEMLAGNPEDGALKCLFEHFTSDESEDNRIAMVDRLRGNILSMDGHLKWRVIDLFGTEPLILLIRMVHPKLPASCDRVL